MSRDYSEYVHIDDIHNEWVRLAEYEELQLIAAGLLGAIECLQEVIGENNECGPCQVAIDKYKEAFNA